MSRKDMVFIKKQSANLTFEIKTFSFVTIYIRK